MRFTVSAVAAVSGLFLLALAFYGQPAAYLREARDQWDELMDRPAHPGTAASFVSNLDEHAAQTQHNAPGSEELALRQETSEPQAPEPTLSAPSQPTPAPRARSSSPGEAIPLPIGPSPQLVGSSPPQPPPEASELAPPTELPLAMKVTPQGEASGETEAASREQTDPTLKLGNAASDQSKSQTVQEQLKSEPTKTEGGKPKPQQTRSDPPKPEAVKREQAKAESPRAEQAKSEPPKSDAKLSVANKTLTAQKTPATSPPLPQPPVQLPLQQQASLQPPLQLQGQSRQQPLPSQQPSVSRQDGDDTQSVLARLRQLSPVATAATQADSPPAPDARTRQPSPSPLPRLNSARAALASGQIEDARRLLQQVQLQLVFGPIDGLVDAPQAASKGAVDVARALDALSANDVALSRRYIDVATGDLSGNPINPPIQQSNRRFSGYAPAYPPRQ